jgi:hypothetical protein
MASAEMFWSIGSNIIKHHSNNSLNTGLRRFKSFYGVSPLICQTVWNLLNANKLPSGSKPLHLLWTLIFLKQYNSEHVNHAITGADEKTFRKWVWIFIELIADLNVVSLLFFFFKFR